MRCDRDPSLQISSERLDSADVIRVQVRQDNLANLAPFTQEVADACGQRSLFLFINRGRVNDDYFFMADDVTVGVCGGRLGRRPHGKADEAGAKLYAPNSLAVCLRDR